MTLSKGIKIIDMLSFVALVMTVTSGLLLEFVLPTRSRSASVWSLTRHEWGDIHFYISIAFLVLMSLHLLIHIKFIKSAVLGKVDRERKYRMAIGLLGLLSLLTLAALPLMSPIENSSDSGGQHLRWETSGD